MSALADLEQLYADLKDDANFQREFDGFSALRRTPLAIV